MLILDGSQGEGGGQIIRTALTLSCITGTPFRVENVRASRKPPGLRPQHVTAIEAAAQICNAATEGVSVGSDTVTFTPGGAVQPGRYEWSVGTAGAATLVMQTVMVPLALAEGESEVHVHGGTHVPMAPSAHYLRDVFTPMLLSMGAEVEVFIEGYGWMPEGGGTLCAYIAGGASLEPQNWLERGPIERVLGAGIGCNLPSHIPQRIANRAINLLELMNAPVDIRPYRVSGNSTGAGLFLTIEYTNGRGGFEMLGRRGMPSEVVAEKAVTDLLAFHDSGAATDPHLADQIVIPLALAGERSIFSTSAITPHLMTNLGVVQTFTGILVDVDETDRVVRLGK